MEREYKTVISFYKNAALACDFLHQPGKVTAKSKAEALEKIRVHCKQWGYKYKVESIERA